ncbi:LacI family DNA-binding transcriptional regulator [Streptomyces sp. NPDC097610]|uniref:LacI family DNA-binding transcriptional regulator n=1 Tax=Streptomyces sp. NPDC097610 TaxID=3157227 RepID=UPI00331F653A
MKRPAKRITSADVAKAAGVSPTTVSYVLNDRAGQSIPEGTRQRVLDAAERLQYRPHASARALAAGRSDIVLLSIPDLPIGPSISRFVEELTVSLAEHGLTLVTHLMAARGRSVPDVCATVGASAVLGFDGFDEATVQALNRLGVSVVLPPTDAHLSAMPPLGRMQAEHLIGRGHRRLGYLLPSPARFHRMGQERLQGVTGACAHAGIAPPLALGAADLDILDLARLVQRWKAEEVTGVCAFNDEHAIALLAAIRHLGLTAPDDLAVIGADDIPMARFAAPPLSTVYFDLEEAGKHRAAAVAAALAGQDVSLPTPRASLRLVERASS